MSHGAAVEARLAALLGVLLTSTGRRPAEELVRQLTDLYGEGLARIVAVLREHRPDLLAAVAADDLVTGLLALHDLHPHDVATRVRRALAGLGGDAGYLGGDGGVVRLWLDGGCASVSRSAVEAVVRDAAPEITRVEFVTAFHRIGMGPPPDRAGRVP
ncbi:NifU family protein [Amycolatopsis kentuckyensis]|uniref:NifU family protein n=1 Tax=Amycolatopsis kentuckyensis TaxID=218823 RepID=UPI003568DF7D